MAEAPRTLMTPEIQALIGKTTDVLEMYGEIDNETTRRYIIGIPDQDPRHWDEELATPRYGGTTSPPTMLVYAALRRPPWEEDTFHETMLGNPMRDTVSMMRKDTLGIEEIRKVAGTGTHLHAGDEVEVYRYPKQGDRVYCQARYVDIQEKIGRDGQPFLLNTTEIRYWNQDNETLLITRVLRIEK